MPVIVDVIIPAFNEEKSISHVICDIPKNLVRNIIVCNNNSSDDTKNVALNLSAIVVDEPRAGYGSACLKGIEYCKNLTAPPSIVVFIDGDYSDYGEEMASLIQPIVKDNFDLVIGSRALGQKEKGAMQPQQIFGNWLATTLMKYFFKYQFTDLGPYRAITWKALEKINMQDKDYGWTVEMQVKAAKNKLKCCEVPVNYRRRIGVSKVSGTIKGTFMAGYKILWTIFKYI